MWGRHDNGPYLQDEALVLGIFLGQNDMRSFSCRSVQSPVKYQEIVKMKTRTRIIACMVGWTLLLSTNGFASDTHVNEVIVARGAGGGHGHEAGGHRDAEHVDVRDAAGWGPGGGEITGGGIDQLSPPPPPMRPAAPGAEATGAKAAGDRAR